MREKKATSHTRSTENIETTERQMSMTSAFADAVYAWVEEYGSLPDWEATSVHASFSGDSVTLVIREGE